MSELRNLPELAQYCETNAKIGSNPSKTFAPILTLCIPSSFEILMNEREKSLYIKSNLAGSSNEP